MVLATLLWPSLVLSSKGIRSFNKIQLHTSNTIREILSTIYLLMKATLLLVLAQD